MEDYKQLILNAKAGQIFPIVREIQMDDPVDFFAKVSDYGRAQNCCLFESREYLAGSSALSFGTNKPALYLTGTGNDFTIKALSDTGRRMIEYLSTDGDKRFCFCESVEFTAESIVGQIKRTDKIIDEQSRLQCTNQMDVLRAVAFSFTLASKPFRVTCGLLGALSYDFIDQFEKLPKNKKDLLGNPDYELYFADNIFMCDHEAGKGYVIVNVIVTDHDRQAIIDEAQKCFDYYDSIVKADMPKAKRYTSQLKDTDTDTNQSEYEEIVRQAKEHIIDGDIFQVVLSRTKIIPCGDEPLDVYKRLRNLNPSPYMFYLNTANTILMGASPELNVRVSGTEDRAVEIRPIAGTKPRGKVDGVLDPDTDLKYEAELKLDRKELAEHIMLVDLARNDIARVSQPGSRIVTEL
ncbi:MAG: chorismate-binding protein, partial [Planctomycetota bacterium]